MPTMMKLNNIFNVNVITVYVVHHIIVIVDIKTAYDAKRYRCLCVGTTLTKNAEALIITQVE